MSGAVASSAFFRVVSATPRLGRWFSDDDDSRGAPKVAVISEGLWRRRFGASPAALGRGVQIDGELYTIVGVAPASFVEAWRFELGCRSRRWPTAPIARTTTCSPSAAAGWRQPVRGADSSTSLPGTCRASTRRIRYTFTARDLHDVLTDSSSRGLWVLLGATLLPPPIACANVANLLLARAVSQERALAVRTSLGATAGQLMALVLGETVALAGAGPWPRGDGVDAAAHLRGNGAARVPRLGAVVPTGACSARGSRRHRGCRDRGADPGDSPVPVRSRCDPAGRRRPRHDRGTRANDRTAAGDPRDGARTCAGRGRGADGQEPAAPPARPISV